MPQLETWSRIPTAIRVHLAERMRDRNISLEDLNLLRIWLDTKPIVPVGKWFKDFGSFKLCGEGKYPKTFLPANQPSAKNFSVAQRKMNPTVKGPLARIANRREFAKEYRG